MNDFDKFQRILRGEIIPDCRLPIIDNPDAPKPCIEYVKQKSKRGGKRTGAGRPIEGAQPIERHNIGIDAQTKEKARKIGGSNVSKGIRIAVSHYKLEDKK